MRRLFLVLLTILLALPATAAARIRRERAVASVVASKSFARVARRAALTTERGARIVRRSSAFTGQRAVLIALRERGVPYRWGGTSPAGFDCSGLVQWVYAHLGITLPRTSFAQFTVGRRVPRGALQPGDLVFANGIGHVGIYVGDSKVVHAPHTGARVRVDSLGTFGFDGARRVVPAY